MTKRTLVLDIEIYANYLLVQFKAIDSKVVRSFEMFDDQVLDGATIIAILRTYQIVTFNGQDFDLPILFFALKGAPLVKIKAACNHIIDGRLRNWQFEQEYGVQVPEWINHVDLREPIPGVQISLKLYGGRLHSKRLRDLPYPPDAVLTREQMIEVREYCENDLDTTIDLWNRARDPKDDIIALREQLTAETGIDMRSKSDAQIGEALVKSRVEKLMGRRVCKPDVLPGTRYKYQPPAFLRFQHPVLQTKFEEVCAADFVVLHDGSIGMPKALEGARVSVGRSTYSMGIGGLHSTEKSQAVVATDDTLLRDVDVISYYPSLILQCGLFPASMGSHFQSVYKDIFNRRVAAKRHGDKTTAQILKIALNAVYGKLGSKYSVLYAPNLLMQVTVTGQLALLMMIERMEAAGIPVVSGNTDGVVMACPSHLESAMRDVVRGWERDTQFETEETRYRALFSRDVNSYVALKEGGGVKTKGALASADITKNPTNEIAKDAVCAYLERSEPIAETVLRCKDIRKFVTVKRVTGGATFRGEHLGRVARWYRSTRSTDAILYGPGKKLGHKVGGSDNAMPCMELPDELPSDVDHGFYIGEAFDLLREIGVAR